MSSSQLISPSYIPLRDQLPPNYGFNVTYMVNILKALLGIEYTLYVKTQNFHWNLIGPIFLTIHKELAKQYKQLCLFIDQIAEQIRKYGTAAPGSFQEFIDLNKQVPGIKEREGGLIGQNKVLSELLVDHERVIQIINSLDNNRIDLATQNLIGEILDFHMKAAWIWRVHQE